MRKKYKFRNVSIIIGGKDKNATATSATKTSYSPYEYEGFSGAP
jgi:hypothetical protein